MSTTILFENVVLVLLADREILSLQPSPAPVDPPSSSSSSRQHAAGEGGLQQLNRAQRGLTSADGVKSMLGEEMIEISSP